MDYHARPELSSSQVAAYLRDPIEWWHHYIAKDWPRPKPSAAMEFGTAVHRMIEVGSLESVVRQIPQEVLNEQGHCKGKAWLEWRAANQADIYLKPGEANPLSHIWHHLHCSLYCQEIIRYAEKEVEHIWNDDDLGPCRVRFDAVIYNSIIDWKTTTKKCARTFAADAAGMHYDVRLALYRRAFRHKYGISPEVVIVAIETEGGYGVSPYRMPDAWMDEAEAKLIVTVDDMRRFSLTNYLNQPVVELSKPRWANFTFEE